ncbi:hypothetical protein MUK42_34309 [Musa troglodytarum]|uniref:Uncharacterized protein n=1 Tax=Musa troglodytarum TaxID=320322 RepID=A0A9E7FMI1_9LILI|nr:hypothetical protein MUK42_34309 [Musa troglodytarum]
MDLSRTMAGQGFCLIMWAVDAVVFEPIRHGPRAGADPASVGSSLLAFLVFLTGVWLVILGLVRSDLRRGRPQEAAAAPGGIIPGAEDNGNRRAKDSPNPGSPLRRSGG